MSCFINHEPKNNHIDEIELPPWYIIHRNAWQWGAGAINGDIINPEIVNGLHKYTYRWDDAKWSSIHNIDKQYTLDNKLWIVI